MLMHALLRTVGICSSAAETWDPILTPLQDQQGGVILPSFGRRAQA